MAVGGVGNGASALDRFQQIRDLARKKLDAPSATPGDDPRARLADVLKRKQAELGQGVAADRPGSARGAAAVPRATQAAPAARAYATPAGPGALGALGTYGRAEAAGKTDPKPRLGRYIDLTA